MGTNRQKEINYRFSDQNSYFHVIESTQTAAKENIVKDYLERLLNKNLISCGWIILYNASKAIEPEINKG